MEAYHAACVRYVQELALERVCSHRGKRTRLESGDWLSHYGVESELCEVHFGVDLEFCNVLPHDGPAVVPGPVDLLEALGPRDHDLGAAE
jgi:hypothetical protein